MVMFDPLSFKNFGLFMLVGAARAGKNVAVAVLIVFVETVVVDGKVEAVVVVVDFVVVSDSAVVAIVS